MEATPTTAKAQELYDCSTLLRYAADSEVAFSQQYLSNEETMSFGHPDPPRLCMFDLTVTATDTTATDDIDGDANPIWMVAYTAHCVVAQILFAAPTKNDDSTQSNSNSNNPIILQVCTLLPSSLEEADHDNDNDNGIMNRDEIITCLTVLALDEAAVVLMDQTAVGVVSTDTSTITRLAIVLGTTESRVLSVELSLDCNTWTTERLKAKSSMDIDIDDDYNNDDNHESFMFDVLPVDNDNQHTESVSVVPTKNCFQPTGGVTSLSPFRITTANDKGTKKNTVYVWIAYLDGMLVRLHHAAFFPSICKASAQQERSLENVLGPHSLVRCQVQLPTNVGADVKVQPLFRYFPSPLAPLSIWKPNNNSDEQSTLPDMSSDEEADDTNCIDGGGGYSYGGNNASSSSDQDNHEALVFGSQVDADLCATVCFYTSEDQFSGGHCQKPERMIVGASDNIVLDAVVGGTKALVDGVLGSAMGAFRWGLGGRNVAAAAAQAEDSPSNKDDAMKEGNSDDRDTVPFPSLSRAPAIGLYAGNELHDMPRKVESCSIDPSGQLVALADNLGRVMLIDLSTKQVVRMWKGFREASCCWLESPLSESEQDKPGTFLVIHSKQRRVVEVWRTRHGSRLCSIQVGRDAQVVSCAFGISSSHRTSCYLVHSNVPGASLNQTEKVRVGGLGMFATTVLPQGSAPAATRASSAPSSRLTVLRLQHLQQLLSTTNVQCGSNDVYKALQEITSPADLATALDLLAKASVLEERMGVEGADLQKKALAYSKTVLEETLTTDDAAQVQLNPNVQLLSQRIAFHSKIVEAYDILFLFETRVRDNEVTTPASTPNTPDSWVSEAMGWVSTYQHVVGANVECDYSTEAATCAFATFASACALPSDLNASASVSQVRLSESSRLRRSVLVHVFKPLLDDVFSFGVVNSIFDVLGLSDDTDYLLKCFGEWFMTLPHKEVYEKGMDSPSSPMVRWLQDLACRELDRDRTEGQPHTVTLNVLFAFCKDSAELVHAFMLGTLCREAVAKASTQKEKVTYGKVSSQQEIGSWESLLRKLRVCLLVSLRLNGKRLGSFPITVLTVDGGDCFSVYEWLAHDELAMSHNHEEIVSLENACENSSYAFDPSSPDGDGSARFNMLQSSCLSATVSEEERAEYMVDFHDEDRFGALLLYLKSHNDAAMLVAHRALLLTSAWSQDPGNLTALRDALSALRALHMDPPNDTLAAAIRLEVWQSQIRPIYRAHLFGFDDVQEVSEGVVGPLLQSQDWLREFGKIALDVLTLLADPQSSQDSADAWGEPDTAGADEAVSWPPVQVDFILKRLVEKRRKIEESAFDAHRVVLSALLVSNDIEALIQCAPAIYESFLPLALFNSATQGTNTAFAQSGFLEDAVITRAQAYVGPAIDSFDLGEIDTLAKIWAVDQHQIRTVFILAMYELEKDETVNELVTRSTADIDVPRFVEAGVDIVCRRLDSFLSGSRSKSTEMRNVLSLLDADLCGWIRRRAKKSRPLVISSSPTISIGSTHNFCLRLLSLGGGGDVDTILRVKIHSLAVLTGTLRKALEPDAP